MGYGEIFRVRHVSITGLALTVSGSNQAVQNPFFVILDMTEVSIDEAHEEKWNAP